MGLPCIPEPYKSVTAFTIEEDLGRAILSFIDAKGLTAIDIQKRYASIRAGHIAKLRRGETLNFKMLSSIAEALGLTPRLVI